MARHKRQRRVGAGRPLEFGDEITLGITPTAKKLLRRWAAKDGLRPSQLLAELIARELLRRDGAIRIVVEDPATYRAALGAPRG